MIAVKQNLGWSLGPGEWDAFITYVHISFGRKPGKRGEGSLSVTPQSSQHSVYRVA